MSSHASLSLEIDRGPRSQSAVVASVAAITVVLPWCLPLSFLTATLLVVIVGCSATASFWRIGWLGGKRAVRTVVWAADGEWRIVDRGHTNSPASLLAASRVLGGMIWLRFMTEQGPRALLFMGSELAPDVRRRLTARLRLQANRAGAGNREPQSAIGAHGLQP